MRLAQIARKVNVASNEIKRFLEKEFQIAIEKDPNFKLDDLHVEAVLKEFEIEKPSDEPEQIKHLSIKKEEVETGNSEKTTFIEEETNPIEALQDSPEETPPVETPEEPEEVDIEKENSLESMETEITPPLSENPHSEKEISIDYESVSEEAEDSNFKEVPVDRNAATIKAPSIKLDGLKILGKIELPEHKKVENTVPTDEEIAQKEAAEIAALDAAMQSTVQDVKEGEVVSLPKEKKPSENNNDNEEHSPFKDKNGIYHFSQEQRQNRKRRLSKLKEKKKAIAKRELKKKYYADKMAKVKKVETAKKVKQKKLKTAKTIQKKKAENKPEPKGFWQKFKNWLND